MNAKTSTRKSAKPHTRKSATRWAGWEEKHKLTSLCVYIEVKRLYKLKILIQEKKKQCKTEYRKECKQVYK